MSDPRRVARSISRLRPRQKMRVAACDLHKVAVQIKRVLLSCLSGSPSARLTNRHRIQQRAAVEESDKPLPCSPDSAFPAIEIDPSLACGLELEVRAAAAKTCW